MSDTCAVPRLEEEFTGAELGDARRRGRLQSIVEKVAASPSSSFPEMVADRSELESFYRFFSNEEVSHQEILRSHFERTVDRCAKHPVVLCLHDTTEFKFSGNREGLMEAGNYSTFFAHFSLAVVPGEERLPLGLLAFQPFLSEKGAKGVLHRGRPKAPKKTAERKSVPREERSSFRWDLGVEAAEASVQVPCRLIHVCDREADDFALLAKLATQGARFVIRGSALRPVSSEGAPLKLNAVLETAPYELCRQVQLTARLRGGRSHPRREARLCRLGVRASTQEFLAPQQAATEVRRITLNVVQVVELEPPPGEAPVQWTLYTTESISTGEDLAFIVDAYRSRWLIEEYFKAIKTGCAFQLRQLTHSHSLLNALAVTLPIAWRLLLVRTVARSEQADQPAIKLWSASQLEVLSSLCARKRPLPQKATIRDAMLSIAAVGGHLKNNGEPGWQTLAKGYFRWTQATEDLESLVGARLSSRRRLRDV